MQYALIYNNRIEVGPRNWNYYFFLEYLEDKNINTANLPRKAPTEAILTDTWKILPVTYITFPENLDQIYEELVGPFWTIQEDHVTGVYSRKDKEIPHIHGTLKNIVAANRYAVETGKLEYTFSDGEIVEIFTEREERMIYLNTLSVLPDDETTPFKFRSGKFRVAVTKAELAEIVSLGMLHIRSAFEWEVAKVAEIESLNTVEDLKAVELCHPTQIIVTKEIPDAN